MGKHIWKGWQTSVVDAPQPTAILYGANLKHSVNGDSAAKKESQEPQKLKQKRISKQKKSKALPEKVALRSGRIVRTATEEDYRLRAVATIGTFFRAKDMKPK